MATFRIPILIWQDFGGNFTVQAITGEEEYFPSAAFSEKRDRAISEVKEHLQWLFEDEWWRETPDYEDLEMLEFRVDIRPEYEMQKNKNDRKKRAKKKKKKRMFTSEETIPIRVPCVYWKTTNGNFYASLPFQDIEFIFNKESELKNLVRVKVQENLQGSNPLRISEYLPPKEVELDELSFQSRRKKKETTSYKETPNLIAVTEPLGTKDKTRKISAAYEREIEVAGLTETLSKEKANVIILGENGVGKSTVLTKAVQQIEKELLKAEKLNSGDDEYYERNPRYRFWQTNGGRLIAGMAYLGEWEERLEAVIDELSDIEGVLCVESLLDLVRYGGQDANESLAAFLIPYLQRKEIRIVCEATPAELDACRRLLPQFVNQFQILRLPEFTNEKALSILTKIADINTQNLKIEYSANVINLVYRLFSRFMPYQKFPGKTTQFLVRLYEKAKIKEEKEITTDQVIESFVKLTGLPELFLRDEITLEIDDVIAEFERNVIGQTSAIKQVASTVTTFKAGLNDIKRPLGVLLFAGPTGVGKTELAKTLANFFFGEDGKEKEKIVRVDMSEYSMSGSATRLLTKSDGSPSDLIKKVRENPFSVVLFDEVEKADAQVFDVLLGLFDEGRLTDRFGRVTNFTSSVVIMTSNLGADRFAKGDIGFNEDENISNEKEIKVFFRPEFFNRIDAVVQFKPLDKDSLYKITEKEVGSMAKREGLQEKNLKLVWSKDVIKLLATKGFDKRYGARPLQRTIETLLTSPLAEFLLENNDLSDAKISVVIGEDENLKLKK